MISSPDSVEFSADLAAQRDAIEGEIDQLRSRKSLLVENDYLDQLEELMLKLAGVYDQAEAK